MRRTVAGQRRLTTRRVISVAGGALAAITLAACTSGSTARSGDDPTAPTAPGGSSTPTAGAPSTPPAAAAAVISSRPLSTEKLISPADPVTVSIAHGELKTVSLLNPAGKAVKGTLAADRTSWRAAEVLGYGKTYRLTATGENADGVPVTKKTTIATVEPDNYTLPTITDIAGNDVKSGSTYGVGMNVRVHFDEAVDKARAERTLSVTTTPKLTGSWYWSDDQNVWWRPKAYYPEGAKVQITAKAYGRKLGAGLYGQADASTKFVIGQKRVSIANGKTHEVKVYFDDRLVKTMPTSMGKGGYEPGNDSINYWTMKGTYTVIGHENPAIMTSGSFGVKKGSPNYYPPEEVYWSTKVSTDGIYLHELNTTTWAQGNTNVSHGCLNLNTERAKWFFNHSRIGDVVEMVETGGPTINFGQGGQWSVPWSTWVKGSAL